MDTQEIITHIDAEIARLHQVKGILSGTTTTKSKLGRPKTGHKVVAPIAAKRPMSPEGRARIAAAQKKRWAKAKKAAKKAA